MSIFYRIKAESHPVAVSLVLPCTKATNTVIQEFIWQKRAQPLIFTKISELMLKFEITNKKVVKQGVVEIEEFKLRNTKHHIGTFWIIFGRWKVLIKQTKGEYS